MDGETIKNVRKVEAFKKFFTSMSKIESNENYRLPYMEDDNSKILEHIQITGQGKSKSIKSLRPR